jgi:hypothetical protein
MTVHAQYFVSTMALVTFYALWFRRCHIMITVRIRSQIFRPLGQFGKAIVTHHTGVPTRRRCRLRLPVATEALKSLLPMEIGRKLARRLRNAERKRPQQTDP